MLRKTILILAFIYIPFFAPNLAANGISDHTDIYLKDINNLHQIPDDVTTTLFEDDEGVMWIGTQFGVIRYDGYEFTRFRNNKDDPHSIKGDWVDTILQAPNGDIWVATEKGIFVYDKKKGVFFDLATKTDKEYGVKNKEIRKMSINERGVWVPRRTTLSLIDPATYQVKHYQHTEQNGKSLRFGEIVFASDDRAFVGTSRGLYLFDQNKETFTKVDPTYNKSFIDLEIDSQGNLWMSTIKEGLRVIEDVAESHVDQLVSRKVSKDIFKFMSKVGENELWAYKYMKGIEIYDAKTFSLKKILTKNRLVKHTLNSNSVSAIVESSQGLVWVGLWGGGVQLYDKNIQHINPFVIKGKGVEGVEATEVTNIRVSKKSGVWLFGKPKLINLDPNNNFKAKEWPEIENALGENKWAETGFLSINEDNEEVLHLVSNHGGILEFNISQNKARAINNGKQINCLSSQYSFVDDKNRLWFSCLSPSALMRYDLSTGKIINVGKINDLTVLPNKMEIKSESEMWLLSNEGLLVVSDIYSDSPELNHIEHFKNDPVTDLAVVSDSEIWVDTSSGLYRGRYENQKWIFEYINTKIGAVEGEGVFGNMLYHKSGWLWGRTAALDIANMNFYELEDNEGADIGAGWLGGFAAYDGATLISAGDMQLAIIEPKHFSTKEYTPNIIISKYAINNQVLRHRPDILSLDAHGNSFSVDFSLLDFRYSSQHEYRYRLEGYDEWVYTDKGNRRASYTNLPVGTYRLKIEGRVKGDEWGKSSVSVAVERLPDYYETSWFKAFIALLLGTALYYLHRKHLQRKLLKHKEREAELSLLVDERTKDLKLSLENLKITQRKLVDSEKLALLGRLVRGLAHELNTPLSVVKMAESMLQNMLSEANQFIASHSEDSASRFQKKSEKTLLLINDNLNKSINLIAHFKSVDIEGDDGREAWLNLFELLERIVSGLEQSVTISGERELEILSQQGSLIKIVEELLKNAKNHGGSDVAIDFKVDCENLVLTVKDSGKGIPPDTLDKMFQPFFSTFSGGGSPGLGLYMVENTVKFVLNGDIRVFSEERGETRFVISVPCEYRSSRKIYA